MDFHELLSVANYNSNEANSESSVKRYSTILPPPKKPDKSSVKSDGIKKFLAKKKAEEAAKVAEARKLKEKLLELRSQSTKNNKKAKIMASRTKDNDFSKIKLSEDEKLSKKKVEMELQSKHLKDKKERMKVRIELEEKEKLLPRKRKRKSKHADVNEHICEEPLEEDIYKKDKNNLTSNGVRKPLKPPPPAMSFTELLKVAEKKMHEPITFAPKKKEEERLMTKKERKIAEEERERLRRKQERLEKGIEPSLYHKTPNNKRDDRTVTKNPHVVHVDKDKATSQFKIPKNSIGVSNSDKSKIPGGSVSKMQPSAALQNGHRRELKETNAIDRQQIKTKESKFSSKHLENSIQKKPSKIRPATSSSLPKPPQTPKIDTEALTADIERRVREKLEKQFSENLEKQIAADIEKKLEAKLEKEMAEKYRITLEEQRKKLNLADPTPSKTKRPPEGAKIRPPINGKVPVKSIGSKKEAISQKPSVPKPPPKKPFHLNPYLDPPRRRLDPIIPPKKRPYRVIEDDDEEDEDDDMSEFIDDGPSVEDENYSQYIKQIFGYDRSKYIDEDDDDIVETSYSEQMKEEMKSARQGYLEDLEEERKQKREDMERKQKKEEIERKKKKMKMK